MKFLTGTANKKFENHTDDQLVSLAQQNDQQAFATLFKRYEKSVFLTVQKILNSKEFERDVSDVAQEAFTSAYIKIGQLQEGTNFNAWLSRVAKNKALDYLRGANVRQNYATSDEEVFFYIKDSGQGPLEIMGNNVLGERLAEVLDTLPEKQKEAFSFRYFEGLSVIETAAKMGVGEGSVKTHFSRAVHKMRDLIDTDPESPNVVAGIEELKL